MSKVIFILLDACGYAAGSRGLGFPEHLCEEGKLAKYRIQGQLPSISRPMYETLMTGVPVWEHGVTNNTITRPSICQNIFSLCRENGLSTAAAAYMWMSELYNGKVFDRATDRYQFDSNGTICNGIFYSDDAYPDSHLFMDADFLLRSRQPDFLLVHSMGIDLAGHQAGSDSSRYHNAIAAANELLAISIPSWLAMGYDIVVTADHGMDAMGIHGGPAEEQRIVPLYVLSDNVKKGDYSDSLISQLEVAPLVCRLLGITPGYKMCKELHFKFTQ